MAGTGENTQTAAQQWTAYLDALIAESDANADYVPALEDFGTAMEAGYQQTPPVKPPIQRPIKPPVTRPIKPPVPRPTNWD